MSGYANIGKEAWVTLRTKDGQPLGTVKGTISDYMPSVEVRDGRKLDMYLLTGIENFQSAHLDAEHEGDMLAACHDCRFTPEPICN